jgi:hypothetical protein
MFKHIDKFYSMQRLHQTLCEHCSSDDENCKRVLKPLSGNQVSAPGGLVLWLILTPIWLRDRTPFAAGLVLSEISKLGTASQCHN